MQASRLNNSTIRSFVDQAIITVAGVEAEEIEVAKSVAKLSKAA
jgi:hypothetical protein